ncbi:unnamed protein product [Euphydryas editha]|uniref:Reverse transcriptase domain-containing protein n=1 Tax=Euphydryas editha TaxID=104508 RepID=A0AAU9U1S9_EUPED|nr:unnamed protein product [Euphydryas editha]
MDVANAFNSISVETIVKALKFHEVPHYLQRLLDAYLREKEVVWDGGDGRFYRCSIGYGVSQGSILGPTLWNVGFYWLLRVPIPLRLNVCYDLCYVDYTFRARNFEEVARLAEAGTSITVNRIAMLAMRVS